MGQKSTGILINNILPHLTGVAFTLFDIETFWLQAEVKIVKSNRVQAMIFFVHTV